MYIYIHAYVYVYVHTTLYVDRGATQTHLRRKEPIVPNVVLAALALGVAAGRFVIG